MTPGSEPEAMSRFELLVQSVTDFAIYMLDTDGNVTSWNAGAERFKGYVADEIIGRHFSTFYTPEDRHAGIPALATAARLVRCSHERWDGGGYPDNLAGDEIPVGARVISVCDAYDAMVTDRPYRKGIGRELALAELRRCAGTQFDPAVVEAFVEEISSRTAAESSAAASSSPVAA